MINIIGRYQDLSQPLSLPCVHVHLYDKAERENRKIGHITLTADTQAQRDTLLEKLKAWL
jgi:5-(carboxyamino)imidazole ribonucleotide synthase